MGNLARFSIDLVGSDPPGYDAAPADVLTLKLESPSGVINRWTVQIWDPDEPDAPTASKEAPLVDLVGATTGKRVDAVTPLTEVTLTLPSSHSHSYTVRSLVNGGIDPNGNQNIDYVFERVIVIRSTSGLRKTVTGEGTKYGQRGLSDAENEIVDLIGSGGGGGGGDFTVGGTPTIGKFIGYDGMTPYWTLVGGLQITAFNVSASVVEAGTTFANPSFTSAQNTPPTTLTLTNSADSESKTVTSTPTAFASSHSFALATPGASVTFTLTGTLPASANAVAHASITAGQQVFWGTSSTPANTEAFIEGLASSALTTGRGQTFTVTPGAGEKIYYACPTRLGVPTFSAGGFVGGFITRATNITRVNGHSFSENYSLFESVTASLPQTTVSAS